MPSEIQTLGSLLRTWRERIDPQEVGIAGGVRRRAKGLRREELASLAGVSTDYVVRLEQGRFRTPSAQVVSALARALRLSGSETELLFRAANHLPPGSTTIDDRVPPAAQRLVARMSDHPLAVFTADWTLLHANPLLCYLFDLPSPAEAIGENLVVRTFVDEISSQIATPAGGDETFERALVADLRLSATELGDDPTFQSLVTTVRAKSPRFAELWDEGRAAPHLSMAKTVHNSHVGDLVIDCDALMVVGSNVRLIVCSALPGTPDAEKLEALRARANRSE
ncbi:helix-turn-helix transcriptional regulator [Glycomyces sp. TRM65418]|uniref:helix-turn-helix domain-containing protein n=1 Tax=Glycomyces sp. TRM65418 TaxID=2867006 RepID=UPI001CE4B720|nr:helix-turn-helix transcriptional regulator [Glycomyces sp. TRM65418]MCC3762910.1 helix-turn-helix transcriptional regulator [Glycomyces sp. TRM65418]QZD56935.1 helix-turn-helix transcriptional regulator [Glycomyces sp. TRM65418]